MKHVLSKLLMLTFFPVLFYSCQQPASENQNAAKYKEAISGVYNALETGDYSRLSEWVSEDHIDHAKDPMVTQKDGIEGLKETFDHYRASFPDVKIRINAAGVSGDTILVFYTMTGTNTGPMMGMPPTNKRVEVNGVDIVRFENGKGKEHWEVFDITTFMNQLGIMEQQPPAEEKAKEKKVEKKTEPKKISESKPKDAAE
jgi:steroid delta-isomerase-like uncharacterized protein